MPDANETIVIDLNHVSKIELYGHITSAMEKQGLNPCDWSGLELGFELPADWPVGEGCEVTMAQLVVMARKLKFRIIINNLIIEEKER